MSQYHDYLDYIQEIGEVMGFKVHRDTLRIPSSKRVSLSSAVEWSEIAKAEVEIVFYSL